jgi:ubiquinone/menaquinone biosynthesis C-methylase UbiE
MNHNDHVDLLRDGILRPGGVWADFGAGSGAFTLALAELILPGGEIFSIDRDATSLSYQEAVFRNKPVTQEPVIHFMLADFTNWLELPPLDGAVMANALHFQKNKEAVLQKIFVYLKPGAHFILVEYNVERGNPWVPYPISYQKWALLASACGFVNIRLLAIKPSRFLKEIYSAVSVKPSD